MSDEIIWEAPQPPPKDWYVRHKAGEALQDPEAAKRSAVDDIQDEELLGEIFLDYQLGVAESDNVGADKPNPAGVVGSSHDLTKQHSGNVLIDPSIVPDYTEYNGYT